MQDPEVDAKFGFLYSGYRLYYWESLEMIRKLLLAGIPVFIAVQPTGSSQAVLGEVVLVGYLFATTYFKPYVKALDNLLAMLSLLGETSLPAFLALRYFTVGSTGCRCHHALGLRQILQILVADLLACSCLTCLL